MQLGAKPQRDNEPVAAICMQIFHSLATITRQSRYYFARTLGKQLNV